jgi:hypothetical protein
MTHSGKSPPGRCKGLTLDSTGTSTVPTWTQKVEAQSQDGEEGGGKRRRRRKKRKRKRNKKAQCSCGSEHLYSQHSGGKGRKISEFEACLVYRVSSRTARATW